MYAIIKTGGKQYRVKEGDVLNIEKLNVEVGEKIEFDEVLVLGEGKNLKVGTPFVKDAKVFGQVVENGKAKKVIIFKYKAKKDYRKKQGHRQPYTMVEITGLNEDKVSVKTSIAQSDVNETVAAKKPVAKKTETKVEKAKISAAMKKDELIEFAKQNNITIDAKATKAVLIETIETALK